MTHNRPNSASYTLINFIKNVVEALGIRPIARYRSIVKFQDKYHRCDRLVQEGDSVRVIETGWLKGDTILKKAEVEKL